MANEIQNEPQEQEIDLIDLMSRACRWTGNLISKIFTTIIYFIIRNRYWYLLLFIIIAVTTIISYKTRDKLFTCSMIVETQRISASDVINLINQWNYNSDSTNMSDRFVVEAELFNSDNNEVLIDVKTQLFNYLDNDPWVINCNNVIKDEQKNMIARIDKEIAQLDSLKNSEYFSESNQYKLDKNGGLMMVSEKDKHLYHNDIISLLSRKQKIERYLYDEPFKVIQDFSEPMQEDNDLFSILKTWLLIGLIFGSMLIIIIDNRKSIKTLIEKSDKK